MRVSLHRSSSPVNTQTKRKANSEEDFDLTPPLPKRKVETLLTENDDEFDEGDPNATSILAFIGASEKPKSDCENKTLQILRSQIVKSRINGQQTSKLKTLADQNVKLKASTTDNSNPTPSNVSQQQTEQQCQPKITLRSSPLKTIAKTKAAPLQTTASEHTPTTTTATPVVPSPLKTIAKTKAAPLQTTASEHTPTTTTATPVVPSPLKTIAKTKAAPLQTTTSKHPPTTKTTATPVAPPSQLEPTTKTTATPVAPPSQLEPAKTIINAVENAIVELKLKCDMSQGSIVTSQQAKNTTSSASIPQLVQPSPCCFLPSGSRRYLTFGTAINAFDDYLVQCGQIAERKTKSAQDANDSNTSTNINSNRDRSSMYDNTTCISLDLLLLVDFRDVTEQQQRQKSQFNFDAWLDRHVVPKMPCKSSMMQLRNIIGELLSNDAVLLAFYTWLRNLSKDIRRVSFVVNDKTSDDVVQYLIKRGAVQATCGQETPFLWKDNPYEFYTMWRHERDRRIVLPHCENRGCRVKVCKPPLSQRDGWLTDNNTTTAPLIIVGHKQRRIANWFTKQGVNIVDFAHIFEYATQVLLHAFSPNGHKTEHKFSFEVVYRLARLLRHRMSDRKDCFSRVRTDDTNISLTRASSSLVSFWNTLRKDANQKCKAFVLVGVDSMLDADGITKLQCEGAKVIAWGTVPRDCAVDINFLVHEECELAPIFRSHFKN